MSIQDEWTKEYASFLATGTQTQWKKIKPVRRAGVATPLFSIYSKKSIGVGEIPDLHLLVDWCALSGQSMIQLLPMNDIGFDFRPYDAQSVCALEPMYLSLKKLQGIKAEKFQKEIRQLRKNFPCKGLAFDTQIKLAKLELLRKMFDTVCGKLPAAFEKFSKEQKGWLEDYAFFKVIHASFHYECWENWPDIYKHRDPHALANIAFRYSKELLFQKWVQWQLFEQLRAAKKYAQSKNVFLMGDMPYLGSRNSDYVWAHPDHFKLELSSGAPPDVDFGKGQRWGMPPYNWDVIGRSGYEYFIRKMKYAENFYHMYRIDHVVGIFRVWTVKISEPLENHGMVGAWDPADLSQWEGHGRNLLSMMIQNSGMLPCAEDLGTVPECSYRVLKEFGIVGLDVQRWIKDWSGSYEFKNPDVYRPNSVAVAATHDTSPIRAWWKYECGTTNAGVFEYWAGQYGVDFERIKERLFDLKKTKFGRFHWRPEMREASLFYQTLGKPAGEVPVLAMLYGSSIREREQIEAFLELPEGWKKKGISAEKRMLEKCLAAKSIFSVQLLQDWLSLDKDFEPADSWKYRINVPATFNDENWRLRNPVSLEDLLKHPVTRVVKELVKASGRG